MKRIVALAIITLALGVVGVVWNPEAVRNQSTDILGCTTTCTPNPCGGPYEPSCTCTTTCTTPVPSGGSSSSSSGGGNYCSQGCECQGDGLGGCWCECRNPDGTYDRDTSQFACEGNPACEWGPTGCYCCETCGGSSSSSSSGGSSSGGCNPNNWGQWSDCFGSPAVKTRQNECGSWETVNCTGTIRARAMEISASVPSCDDVRNSPLPVDGTIFQFSSAPGASPALLFPTDTFGTSDSSSIPGWDKQNPARIVITSTDNQAGGVGGYVRIGNNGWVRRNINATGYSSLQLQYSWQGDSQAESADIGYVEYCTGAGCTPSTPLASHALNATSWQTNTLTLPVNNQVFTLRFRTVANDGNEHFRVDTVSITGVATISAQTQSESTYATFPNLLGGYYTLYPQPPAGSSVLRLECWSKVVNIPMSGFGLSAYLSTPNDSDTLQWDLGYGPPGPWVQTGGGNVIVGGNLTSRIPSLAFPRQFNLVGAGGYPGLVTYGTTYDLDSSATSSGSNLVSSTKWLAQGTVSGTNWYEYFKNRFGLANATTNDNGLFSDVGALTKPTIAHEKPYFLQADNVATSGPWSIGDTDSIIMVIDGNLTINGPITITGNGFIAFIVEGNISVSPTVGVAAISSSSVLDGIYVAGGAFQTGASTNAGTERLVGTGSFIANSFTLQRDLDSVVANDNTAAELFIYEPRFFMQLPNSMLEVPITWQEVAP